MLQIISTLLLIVHICSGVVLIFYGSIDISSCNYYVGWSWDSCVSNCQHETNTYAAYSTPEYDCYLCAYGNLQNITYSSIKTDYIIALKSDASSCVDPIDLSTPQKIDKLKICNNTNYIKLVRENYTLCAQRLEYSDLLNEEDAIDKCTSWGGSIIGLENDAERTRFAELDPVYSNTSSSWLGFTRFSGSSDFVWTDPWLSGSGSVAWADGQPVTGNDCGALEVGTGLIRSVACGNGSCNDQYCPNFVLCGQLIQ